MRKLILTFVLTQLAGAIALGESPCNKANEYWNGGRCITVGGGSATAAALTLYSTVKYKEAAAIRTAKKGPFRFYVNPNHDYTDSNIRHLIPEIEDLKKNPIVRIEYIASELENKNVHLLTTWDLMSAAKEEATKTDQLIAKMIKQPEPDMAAIGVQRAYSKHWREQAELYFEEYQRAQVPGAHIHKITQVYTGTGEEAAAFATTLIKNGGRVSNIFHTPALALRNVSRVVKRARGGAVGALAATAFVAEEVRTGYVTEALQNAVFVPQIRQLPGESSR